MVMSSIECEVCQISWVLESAQEGAQLKELIATQWEEVDHRRKTSNLDVKFDKYLEMEELGVHFIVMAYDGADVIGYNSMFISPTPHTGEITALTDTIFIKKEYRQCGLGTELIRLAEEESKKRGATNIMVTFKNNDSHPAIVQELGFFSYETIYAKYIGG